MSIFLNPEEVAEITGIKRGRDGLSRNQMQAEQLRKMGVAFYLNAAGQAKIPRAMIEGAKPAPIIKLATWHSPLLNI